MLFAVNIHTSITPLNLQVGEWTKLLHVGPLSIQNIVRVCDVEHKVGHEDWLRRFYPLVVTSTSIVHFQRLRIRKDQESSNRLNSSTVVFIHKVYTNRERSEKNWKVFVVCTFAHRALFDCLWSLLFALFEHKVYVKKGIHHPLKWWRFGLQCEIEETVRHKSELSPHMISFTKDYDLLYLTWPIITHEPTKVWCVDYSEVCFCWIVQRRYAVCAMAIACCVYYTV